MGRVARRDAVYLQNGGEDPEGGQGYALFQMSTVLRSNGVSFGVVPWWRSRSRLGGPVQGIRSISQGGGAKGTQKMQSAQHTTLVSPPLTCLDEEGQGSPRSILRRLPP
jgi:hypothetical protein